MESAIAMHIKPWMMALGGIWVCALAMSAHVLSITATSTKHVRQLSQRHQEQEGKRLIPRGLGVSGRPSPTAGASVRSIEARPPTQESTAQAAVDPTPWQPVIQRVLAAAEPLGPADVKSIKEAITPVSNTERQVDRAKVWKAVKGNPLQVMRETTMAPVFDGFHLVGVKLLAVPDHGILQQSGFQSGDVVQTVNGEPLIDPARVLQLPALLQQPGSVNVQVLRDGHPVTLTYRMQ
ncbi:MAG: hypothetical protein HY598_04405 [Candidatus Omnitrophica bacterium]|nr:hypothetical protein [Candidatus Omnitrophota bacterium]